MIQRMTWEEFERRFPEFVGGTCELDEIHRDEVSLTILGLKIVEDKGERFLWVSTPREDLPSWLTFEPFHYEGALYEPGEGLCIFFEPLRGGTEDLGMNPGDMGDGRVMLANPDSGVIFVPPHH